MDKNNSDNLDSFRQEIAKIDDEIILLLIERFKLTHKLGLIKKNNNLPVLNKEVEDTILTRLVNNSHGDIDSRFILKIYTEIFEESKRRQSE